MRIQKLFKFIGFFAFVILFYSAFSFFAYSQENSTSESTIPTTSEPSTTENTEKPTTANDSGDEDSAPVETKPIRKNIKTKIYDRKPRPVIENKRAQPIQHLYDDPNQPAAVRKTHRHPDADKLEIDFD